MKIEVIKAKCTGCTLCVRECPVEAIRMLDEKAVIDLDTCILCGACEKVCPVDAILFEKPTRHSKEDLSLYRDVWVFSEQRGGKLADVALELVGEGKKLAKARGSKLCAVLLGHNVSGLARELAFHGAERVYVVDSPRLERFSDESYSQAMVWLIERHRPEIVLAGATAMGRSFIPRVAAEIRTGLTADCTSLGIDAKGNLIQTRPAFGGNIMATILCTKSRPQMATVRPKVMKKPARDEGLSAEIVIEVPGDEILASRQSVIDEIVDAAKGPSLQAAEIIVAGGAGLKKKGNFRLIYELADAIGAAVGASRTAVDRGWMPYTTQVGQTGKTVCPRLYIAVGISGAIQHLVGMQTAEKIIAINSDPHAPIFRVADVGIAGDLFEIVPRLIAELKARGR